LSRDSDREKDALEQSELKPAGRMPRHVAIIMDGNGRWAERRDLTRTEGHRSARDVVRDTVRVCGELGIEFLTLFTFGTENWNRPWKEVLSLMQLLRDSSLEELPELQDNDVRLVTTGHTERLAKQARLALDHAIRATASNKGLTLNLALSYDGRSDIIHATKQIAAQVASGELSVDDIDQDRFATHLLSGDLPDPDLMIRTSGEVRLSNFMLWQSAYTEFVFTPVFWPDFERKHFYEAIRDYQSRERRYGKTSAQVEGAGQVEAEKMACPSAPYPSSESSRNAVHADAE
jgi:undecaprenyl diphosphate synthase